MPTDGIEVLLHFFFNFGTRKVLVVNATPRPLYPQLTRHQFKGGWVSPREILDGYAKLHAHRASIPGLSSL
jgi:hypothetical protein